MSLLLAYFDPGPGSLLMQALVGGTAGLIVFGRYLWNTALMRSNRPQLNLPGTKPQPCTVESSAEIPVEGV